MSLDGRLSEQRAGMQQRLLVVSGVVVAFVGLALYAMAEGRIDHFLSSALVFTGTLMVVPQLVARAVREQSER